MTVSKEHMGALATQIAQRETRKQNFRPLRGRWTRLESPTPETTDVWENPMGLRVAVTAVASGRATVNIISVGVHPHDCENRPGANHCERALQDFGALRYVEVTDLPGLQVGSTSRVYVVEVPS
jgi:hypothetical protein